jgi:superfamily I DNA/RNA helicase
VYRYVFVDEYQDINQVQHELLRCLVGRGVRITAIGDPNQAIYGFRGANHRFFSAFADSFEGATTLYLHENYRTAKAILTASGQLLENPGSHGVPPLIARLYAQGALISHEAGSDRAEAEYVVQTIEQLVGGTSHFSHNSGRVAKEESGEYSFGDIAVLYRLNALKAPLEEALDRSGIPYQASADLPLAQNPNVGDALMLLRLACGESVEVGALRSFLAKKTSDELAECVENVWLERSGERIGIDALLSTGGSYPEIPEADQSRVADVVKAVERLRRVIRKQGICNAIDALHRTGLIAGIPTGKKDAEPWQRFARIVRTAGSMAHLLDRVMLQRAGDCIETRVEKVSLMTLHASKGLEFPVVLIAGCEEGIVPLCLEGMTAQREEERRLLYVGMTRARKRLYITHARRRLIFGQSRQLPASSFLDDIDEELRPYDARAGEGERTAEDRTRQLDLFS